MRSNKSADVNRVLHKAPFGYENGERIETQIQIVRKFQGIGCAILEVNSQPIDVATVLQIGRMDLDISL